MATQGPRRINEPSDEQNQPIHNTRGITPQILDRSSNLEYSSQGRGGWERGGGCLRSTPGFPSMFRFIFYLYTRDSRLKLKSGKKNHEGGGLSRIKSRVSKHVSIHIILGTPFLIGMSTVIENRRGCSTHSPNKIEDH